MITITRSDYAALPRDYRDTWAGITYPELTGRRTWLTNLKGATVLLIEGVHFEITDDMAPCHESAGGFPAVLSSNDQGAHQ